MEIKANEFLIIPSVRMIKDLAYALTLDNQYILLSEAHIGNLRSITDMCHKANKKVIVNLELIGGLNLDKIGILFLKQLYKVDVVIGASTAKINMVSNIGLDTIQRITLMDSKSFDTSLKSIAGSKCSAIEIRPCIYGLKFIEKIRKVKNVPLLLGGFIDDGDMIHKAKEAGFVGATTSCKALWNMKANQSKL
ncbi:glycerol-3-phosphate responsive antiterminator [Clostridium estertheticum]|uniref:glycerol-3-phosphate responsive antiterminator n=1 Tax=Clostridium estertheticum TaxID=238834 RepID=UPI001CF485C6|nr:glycerol-3-phosphate responsive antiterminator [Clostridium estertheticum]MCB2362488.1 glycerol-3-phosphate responsive antiterminator [Clostridium estertheticum]